jgi:hypothetical protein
MDLKSIGVTRAGSNPAADAFLNLLFNARITIFANLLRESLTHALSSFFITFKVTQPFAEEAIAIFDKFA